MPLEPGTSLGPYQVTAKIGEGGMGEVYRARDTKLDRDVALKVLPQAFTDDPDRLARFEREAKVLASLNHPNIGHIYGLEEAEGQKALVLGSALKLIKPERGVRASESGRFETSPSRRGAAGRSARSHARRPGRLRWSRRLGPPSACRRGR